VEDEKITLVCPEHGETWAIRGESWKHVVGYVCDICYVEYRFRQRTVDKVYVEKEEANK